ncbi:MAG: CoA activase, partial [Deltaproteobacteria bacterium]|nr:CoA activase [Deltaproteobacteria bacterium]
KQFNRHEVCKIAISSSTPAIINHATSFDSRICYITAARHLNEKVGSLLIVGGEKFGVVLFDQNGEYLNYRSNSCCAAGTGSFLDQQAKRLNLCGIEEFSEVAYRNSGAIPKIASRCAVFAKTDLIHAQQEGYALENICDGLSYGLAKNIVDTLFTTSQPGSPFVLCGGVSRNRAVTRHIAAMLDVEVTVDEHSQVYGAIGAALNLLEEGKQILNKPFTILKAEDLIRAETSSKCYGYEPLDLKISKYPDFSSFQRYEFKSSLYPSIPPVEVDIYEELSKRKHCLTYLGLDIGSTSTKAVLLDQEKRVLAGFYTRTSGRPVEAVQSIFHGISELETSQNISLDFSGVGTTGSGRKFIGEIVGADVVLDEITAHARSAVELDAEVDTIIEIGGQDSKFTTLKNGMVTFSVMNNVCAAGTGSFIEEQAKKLSCPLDRYSDRAEGIRAPVTSDKCTVFMERDLNYYLSEGYSVNEALASVLHAVRENYLAKVANESQIGNRIFFQGATAKNKALVAAFEQRLHKPIRVSRYCHLAGALGVALHLSDEQWHNSTFRGIDLHRQKIPVKTEVCDICTNHCKIKTAEVNGQILAFGFLCGRDYETESYVAETCSGFNLIRERRKAFFFKRPKNYQQEATIGIPAALHLYHEIDLWKKFFDHLSIRVITSEKYNDGVKDGKKLTGAEFCAPVTALHGHVSYLNDKADYIFLPNYMEVRQKKNEGRRHYCYYTQFAPAVVSQMNVENLEHKILNPDVQSIRSTFYSKVELYKMLKPITSNISFLKVSTAYDRATEYFNRSLLKLKNRSQAVLGNGENDIKVVLLGRPYTVLSKAMNGNIPEILDKLGIKTFFQDMLTYDKKEIAGISSLLKTVHWHFAARILEAAEIVASREGLYPVLITSFKCTPDAFVVEVFKNLLESRGKPYLILQLDEHDSSVGYETRIEAGIRSFRNHHRTPHKPPTDRSIQFVPAFLSGMESLRGKTLLLPNFDEMPGKLLEASLRKEGIDARLLEEREDLLRKSMRFNIGQCLPINVLVESCIDFIEKNNLDPAKTVVWNIDSNISCNLGVINYYINKLLTSYGNGFEKVSVYAGEITYLDISVKVTLNAYFAYMFGGMLKKIGCQIRPYEHMKGSTDAVIKRAMDIFYEAFLYDQSKEAALREVIELFEAIQYTRTSRPKVAIFGDLYARDNDVFNQHLIQTIEENGGEVITTPYSEYMKMIAESFIHKWIREGLYTSAAAAQILKTTMPLLEKKYKAWFNRITREPEHKKLLDPEKALASFNVNMLHTGESMETILKIFTFINNYPDISLFVQTSPSLCCPSLVTEAMAKRIEHLTGVPVVSIEYDGTGGFKNDDIIPYLKYPRRNVALDQKMAL